MEFQSIVILDFGSQYTQLIARRIRQLKVYSVIVSFRVSYDEIKNYKPAGIILSGGPASVYAPDAPKLDSTILSCGLPILGICYGMQLIAYCEKGNIVRSGSREYGRTVIDICAKGDLLGNIPAGGTVWMSHGDRIDKIPENYIITARSDNALCAFENPQKKIYGLQFHPEVQHTQYGTEILSNFIFRICGISPGWSMPSFIDTKIREIREQTGGKAVVLGLSGGVDSTVLAVLLHKAIGDQLTAVFVDNGLLRLNEGSLIKERFARHFQMNIKYIDAGKNFLKRLKKITDPEKKRLIIGDEFVKVFFSAVPEFDFLAQGTLYPDVIESVSVKGPSDKIKTHHNRVKRILDLKSRGMIIEPFQELFKDEVREIGRLLDVPEEIIQRHPFPGPGLAVRILGEITPERVNILQRADHIVIDEIKKAGLYNKIWQAFGVLLPVKAVGVMGDERTYADVLAIRAVESVDGMTADWVKLPYELLETFSRRIIGEIKEINRVVYDICSKPPGTIEWE